MARLSREVFKAADTAAVRARLDANGGFQLLGSAADLGTLMRADNQRFKALMKDLGLVPAGAN